MQKAYFNLQKRKAAITRAKKRDYSNSAFLHIEAVKILSERLMVTNRNFTKIAILFDGPFSSFLLSELSAVENLDCDDIQFIALPTAISSKTINTENLNLKKSNYDLIISLFDLHWLNDLPGALNQINEALLPDGLFMAVLPSEGTLDELNNSLVEAESKLLSGASMRVGPFAQVRQLGDLLRRAGFQLPVGDVEQRLIHYSSFERLVDDLRNTGSSNVNNNAITAITKSVYQHTKKNYTENHANEKGKIIATVNLAFLSGWKEHSSQQKPLKRGSAKNNLSDFL